MAKSSFFSGTGTTSNDVDSVTSSKAAAEAAATNAATSETNAASSASSASTSASNASTSASNASNSATAAATSETNAASSATAASASQTSATNSASAAATSATNAATSEANAATSETNAASSATAAATSATSAATSLSNIGAAETNASNSATAAATSATSASTSATNAATSETNASTSATTASTAATNAATSETNAATSETNAATSATNAATSETNAATSATSASTSASAASTSATAAAASQSAAAASAASAASAYDTFDDRYLGSKTADPTVDNDGNALVSGALYFNSTANEMRVYDGANWIAATSAGNVSLLEYKYTATSGQTTFSGADDSSNTLSYTQDNLIVTLNGVVLENGTDYTATTGTSVVLASGAATSDELNVIAFKSFTTADMVSSANGGTFYNNIDVQGTITSDDTFTLEGAHPDIALGETDTTNLNTGLTSASGAFQVSTINDSYNFGARVNRLNVDHSTGDISFYEDTGTTAKFFWDASAEKVEIAGSGGLKFTGGGVSQDLVWGSSGSDYAAIRVVSPAAQDVELSFHTTTNAGVDGAPERMRIDSSGNVGIGTSSPQRPLHVDGVEGVARFTSTASGNNGFEVGIGASSQAFLWQSENSYMHFATNATERMRIDSSGNLLVGTTSATPYGSNTAGIAIKANRTIEATCSGAATALFNRSTNDGNIVNFGKDGTTVGSIGTEGGSGFDAMYIANGDAGLIFQGYANDAIIPFDGSTLDKRDAAIDLGYASGRFKDLYLSGGVYLGGTGSANKLDDYEEGTFNLALSAGATSNGYVLSSQNCKYTKIGNVCYVTGEFNFSTVPSSYDGAVGFTGLPFTSGFSNSHQIGVAREVSTSGDMFVTQVSQGLAEIGMNAMDGITNTDNQSILANKTYSFSNTYITT